MTDLPHWHWDGNAAVYDDGRLRCRVEVDDDGDVGITETWMGSVEPYTTRYIPVEVMRAVLARHGLEGEASDDCAKSGRFAEVAPCVPEGDR